MTGTSGDDGRFGTGRTLADGLYSVSVTGPGYLRPSGRALQLTLSPGSNNKTLRVSLPYTHSTPQAVSTTAATALRVNADAADLSTVSGRLVYSRGGSEFTVPMSKEGQALVAELPAQLSSDPIEYRMIVEEAGGTLSYSTGNLVLLPKAPGGLASLRIEPSLDGGRVRVGDTYRLRLVVRDAVGGGIEDRFRPGNGGTVAWGVSGRSADLSVPDSEDPTLAILTIHEAGPYHIDVQARLDAAQSAVAADFQAGAFSPESMTAASPDLSIDNQSAGVQLAYRAVSADGADQILGSSLEWTVTPPQAGTVSSSGFFVPTDPTFIGPVAVQVRDGVSEKTATASFSLFRKLPSGTPASLTDGRGVFLEIPANAIPFAADVGLSRPELVGPKRNATPVGQNGRFTVGNGLVRFSLRADRALAGDSLQIPVRLTLPEDASLRLLPGSRSLARFDASTLRWNLLSSEEAGTAVTSGQVFRISEFGTVIANEGLGLTHVAVLPSPFSPRVAPLLIGYALTTPDPSASVSINVFNFRGELVRALVRSELQEPGRYGSASSRRRIEWDGLTDQGLQARNGRYLIEIRADDTTGTTTRRISVVLIK
ncbi:MAG: hypothetical protein ACI80V_001318 [Rhodothermales bacterium]